MSFQFQTWLNLSPHFRPIYPSFHIWHPAWRPNPAQPLVVALNSGPQSPSLIRSGSSPNPSFLDLTSNALSGPLPPAQAPAPPLLRICSARPNPRTGAHTLPSRPRPAAVAITSRAPRLDVQYFDHASPARPAAIACALRGGGGGEVGWGRRRRGRGVRGLAGTTAAGRGRQSRGRVGARQAGATTVGRHRGGEKVACGTAGSTEAGSVCARPGRDHRCESVRKFFSFFN